RTRDFPHGRPFVASPQDIPREEKNMPVAKLVDNPEGTAEAYEAVRARIGLEQPVGSILHVAGPGPNWGFRLIELWDSREEAERFIRECLRPAFEAAGVPGPFSPPQFWTVHNVMMWGD